MAVVTDIAIFLENTFPWITFQVGTSWSDEGPDLYVAVLETGGFATPPGGISSSRTFQIIVRAPTAAESRDRCDEIYERMGNDGLPVLDFTTTRSGIVSRVNPPAKIGVDQRQRTTFGFNMNVHTTAI